MTKPECRITDDIDNDEPLHSFVIQSFWFDSAFGFRLHPVPPPGAIVVCLRVSDPGRKKNWLENKTNYVDSEAVMRVKGRNYEPVRTQIPAQLAHVWLRNHTKVDCILREERAAITQFIN